jgi:UDPglucose--hexose-1-phosphate uridylyltransferase
LKTPIPSLMSDGRELIYFTDASNDPLKPVLDKRPAETRPSTNELRQDPLTGDWISVSPHRGARAFLPPKEACPLCPSTEEYLSEIPGPFDVAVFENRNPSFGPDQELIAPEGDVFNRTAKATGRCEVVVFSPEHTGSLAGQTPERFRTVVDAWIDRTKELSKIDGVQQVFIFENRGEEIGVTLHHPHGQIYAYPFVTPTTKKLQQQIEAAGEDFFENLLASESNTQRVLIETEDFISFVPFAARWPIEIHILPKRHLRDLTELNESETQQFAQIYQKLLGALDALYDSPTPYIAAIHQAPKGDSNIRMMVKITSPRRAANKLKYLAGSESAMGAFITDVAPESIAEMIKGVLH